MKVSSLLTLLLCSGLYLPSHAESAFVRGAKEISDKDPEQGFTPAEEAQRVVDGTGLFSFIPPANWQQSTFQGMKYNIVKGPATNNFSPNFTVVEEPYAGDLDTYLQLNEKGVVKTLPKCKVLSSGDFKTAAGLAGKFLVVSDEQYNMQLRQTFYIFPKNGVMFLVTTSCLDADGEKLLPVFTRSMKSFRFEAEQANKAEQAKEEARRIKDATGEFSFAPPVGWKQGTFENMKYNIVTGEAANGFAPNFTFVDEAYAGDLDTYLKLNEAGVLKSLPKCEVVSKGTFKTNAGLEGRVLVVTNEQYNKKLQQSFYIFPNGGTMYIVTTSCLQSDGDKLAPAFNKAVKTFQFEKK